MGGVVGRTGKYKRTPEMLANYSRSAKNRVYTDEGRKKISEARKILFAQGKHPNIGKHWKIREEAIEARKNNPNYKNHLGYEHTEETKKRISLKKIEQFKNNPQLAVIARMAGIKGILKQAAQKEPNKIEKAVYDFLEGKGIIFERQKPVGNRFVVDVYIPSLNLVVEVDGTYWHSTPRGIETDKRKNAYLQDNGFSLIRLTEVEIKNGSFKDKLEPL